MKRIVALFGVVLFMVGVLIVPALHSLHSDDCDSSEHSESHNPDTCTICQVAVTALVVNSTHIAIDSVYLTLGIFNLPDLLLEDPLIPDNHLARAPPVA